MNWSFRVILLAAASFVLALSAVSGQLADVALFDVGGTEAGAVGMLLAQCSAIYAVVAVIITARALGYLKWWNAERIHWLGVVIGFSTVLPMAVVFSMLPVVAAAYALVAGLTPTLIYLLLTRPREQSQLS